MYEYLISETSTKEYLAFMLLFWEYAEKGHSMGSGCTKLTKRQAIYPVTAEQKPEPISENGK